MNATVPIVIRSLVSESVDPQVAGLRVIGRNRLILFEDQLRKRGAARRGWIDLGRVRQRGIQLKHPTVSRKHCRIQRTREGEWQLSDRDSMNGLFVASHGRYSKFREVESVTLRLGMIIRLGDVWLTPVNAAGDCPLMVISFGELARVASVMYGSANEAQNHLGRSRQTITRMLADTKRALRAA